EIERLFNPVFMGFEQIHGAVEMLESQGLSTLNADVLAQPLFITVEFRTGHTSPVGHHGKESPFDREIEFPTLQLVCDDIGEAQSLPKRFQDVERTIGPGIDQAPLGGVLHNLFRLTFFEDTAGEVSQALRGSRILGSTAIMENADLRAL